MIVNELLAALCGAVLISYVFIISEWHARQRDVTEVHKRCDEVNKKCNDNKEISDYSLRNYSRELDLLADRATECLLRTDLLAADDKREFTWTEPVEEKIKIVAPASPAKLVLRPKK